MLVKLRNAVRLVFIYVRYIFFTKLYGMHIHPSCRISTKANLDKTYPEGVFIGRDTYVAAGAYILAHDFARGLHLTTTIGHSCFIGINAIIMPGITIGDNVIIGSGSIVTKNIPSNCIAAGNPATVLKTGIVTTKFGQLAGNKTT